MGELCKPDGVTSRGRKEETLANSAAETAAATTFLSKKKREEKSNSPPGLKFGFWLRKLFGAVKSTNALVLLFLR